jgi:aerobic-type carbon monoxide dehydrogenase small subunit (CoxS/CutS family)
LVMAATGYLGTNPSDAPGSGARRFGNLCRCQDYNEIFTALMHGAELMRG